VLCATELVTNALQAQCTSATIGYTLSDAVLRLSVTDDADGQPEVRHPEATDTRGRGLLLISTLAHRWGVDRAGGRKQVWVELLCPA